jgi:PIN domain nuclease of toxin-antitoxin system
MSIFTLVLNVFFIHRDSILITIIVVFELKRQMNLHKMDKENELQSAFSDFVNENDGDLRQKKLLKIKVQHLTCSICKDVYKNPVKNKCEAKCRLVVFSFLYR